jgi:hypothetical protein
MAFFPCISDVFHLKEHKKHIWLVFIGHFEQYYPIILAGVDTP